MVNIPDSVIEIGDEAFEGCTGLALVNIPDSATEIGRRVFYGCTGITAVCMPGSCAWKYCEDNGIQVKEIG